MSGNPTNGEQRVVIDPRAAFRARQRRLDDDDPIAAPPPSLLPEEGAVEIRPGEPFRWNPSLAPRPSINLLPTGIPDDEPDPLLVGLRLRFRPGQKPNRAAAVRVYHRLEGAPEVGLDGRCWAFTITRVAYERLVTERVLDSEGATYPTGERVVPPGIDPLYVSIQCGSCGTQSVRCLQMEFWQDGG